MDERKPKFEIAQAVKIKLGKAVNMELFILEIIEQTCKGGKEISYRGRVWADEKNFQASLPFLQNTYWFQEEELEG